MDEIKDLLTEKLKGEIEHLSTFKGESDEKSKAVANIDKLYRLRIDEMKVEAERDEQESQRKDKKWDRWLNVGLQALIFIGGTIAYDCWYRRGLKFEETGTITSPQTRNLLSKMIPRR